MANYFIAVGGTGQMVALTYWRILSLMPWVSDSDKPHIHYIDEDLVNTANFELKNCSVLEIFQDVIEHGVEVQKDRLVKHAPPLSFPDFLGNKNSKISIFEDDRNHIAQAQEYKVQDFLSKYDYNNGIQFSDDDKKQAEFFKEDLLNTLFDIGELNVDIKEGFVGRPPIGSTVVTYSLKKSEHSDHTSFSGFVNNLHAGDNIIICGSTVGGMGAGTIPSLTEAIHNKNSEINIFIIYYTRHFDIIIPQKTDTNFSQKMNRLKEALQINAPAGIRYFQRKLYESANVSVLLGLDDKNIDMRIAYNTREQVERPHYLYLIGAFYSLLFHNLVDYKDSFINNSLYSHVIDDEISPNDLPTFINALAIDNKFKVIDKNNPPTLENLDFLFASSIMLPEYFSEIEAFLFDLQKKPTCDLYFPRDCKPWGQFWPTKLQHFLGRLMKITKLSEPKSAIQNMIDRIVAERKGIESTAIFLAEVIHSSPYNGVSIEYNIEFQCKLGTKYIMTILSSCTIQQITIDSFINAIKNNLFKTKAYKKASSILRKQYNTRSKNA